MLKVSLKGGKLLVWEFQIFPPFSGFWQASSLFIN